MIWYAHLDMDAFFASIELASRPYFKGLPFAVGGSERSRTVVSAASYKAREYGIRAGMPMYDAFRRCPGLIVVNPDMEKYSSISSEIFSIIEDIAGNVDVYSIDEGFFYSDSLDNIVDTAKKIDAKIKEKLSLTASIGIAKNRLIAKMASDESKPHGFTVIEDEYSYIGEKDVGSVVGIGRKTRLRLNMLGIYYVKQIRDYPVNILKKNFNSYAYILREISYGRDCSNMMWNLGDEVKSVGNTHTMDKDTMDPGTIESLLSILSEHVSFRMKKQEFEGNLVTLTVRYADFHTFTKQKKIYRYISGSSDIFAYSADILRSIIITMPVRLIGISVSNLRIKGLQISFDFQSNPKKDVLVETLDEIKERFGEWSIMKCKSVEIKERNIKGRRMTI